VSAVALRDVEELAQQREQRKKRHVLADGGTMRLGHPDALRPAVRGKLRTEPALPGTRRGHHADDLPLSGERPLERRLQGGHLLLPSDEARKAAGPRDVEARAEGADTLELEDVQRLGHPLDARGAEIAQREVPGDELRGVLGQIDPARLRERLHALRESDGVSLRGVVHAQVLADLPDHDLSRVDPHAHREVDAARDA
jgi:hypothetical protein